MQFFTAAEDHRARNGQECSLVRRLTQEEADLEEVGPMYRVRFADGTELDAFEDELEPMPGGEE